MQNKDNEKVDCADDLILTGQDAKHIRKMFRYSFDSEYSETLEILFEHALWGLAHNGGRDGTTPNKDIAKYNWHFSSLRDIKKLLAIVCNACQGESKAQTPTT